MLYTTSLDRSTHTWVITAGLFVVGIAMMMTSMASHAAAESRDTSSNAAQLSIINVPVDTTHRPAKPFTFDPLTHRFASGLTIHGIRLSESLFLTQVKEDGGHPTVGVSLKAGVYLYQLGTDQLTVSLLF